MNGNSIKRWVLMSVLAVAVTGVGAARADGGDDGSDGGTQHHHHHHHHHDRMDAPEIDPVSAASGIALLAGGIVVLRSRRALR